jgi:hypothetical protein
VQGPKNKINIKSAAVHKVAFVACVKYSFYADDVNLLGDNMGTIKESTESLTDADKEVGLEVNAEKTMYMFLSCHRNEVQNNEIK